MANSSRIEQIKQFLKTSPDDPFLNYALAIEYVGIGDDVEAKRIFKDLIHNHPNYHATYYHLAKLYEREADFSSAEKTYESGIAICRELKEMHAMNELRSALDELLY